MKTEQVEKLVVEVESWQMQCCGVPFKISDEIEWFACKCSETVEKSSFILDYYYEQHSSNWQELFKIKGIVCEIKALYYSLELHAKPAYNNGCTHYLKYQKMVDLLQVDGTENGIDGLELGDFIVVLSDCVILSAKQEEITFS